jgi:hypothetical protein
MAVMETIDVGNVKRCLGEFIHDNHKGFLASTAGRRSAP